MALASSLRIRNTALDLIMFLIAVLPTMAFSIPLCAGHEDHRAGIYALAGEEAPPAPADSHPRPESVHVVADLQRQ